LVNWGSNLCFALAVSLFGPHLRPGLCANPRLGWSRGALRMQSRGRQELYCPNRSLCRRRPSFRLASAAAASATRTGSQRRSPYRRHLGAFDQSGSLGVENCGQRHLRVP
jgi:hypothetical protein